VSTETLLEIGLELAVLVFLAGLYYIWQRQRILNGPRGWRQSRLVELHHRAVNETRPESYRDLVPFIDALEKKMASDYGHLDDAFLFQWETRELPPELRAGLQECAEWARHSTDGKK